MTHVFHPAMTRLNDDPAISPKRQGAASGNQGEAFRQTLERRTTPETGKEAATDETASVLPEQGKAQSKAPIPDKAGKASDAGASTDLKGDVNTLAAEAGQPPETLPEAENRRTQSTAENAKQSQTEIQPPAKTGETLTRKPASPADLRNIAGANDSATALHQASDQADQVRPGETATGKTASAEMAAPVPAQAIRDMEAPLKHNENPLSRADQANESAAAQAQTASRGAADQVAKKHAHTGIPAAQAVKTGSSSSTRTASASSSDVIQAETLDAISRKGAAADSETAARRLPESDTGTRADLAAQTHASRTPRLSDIPHPAPDNGFTPKASDTAMFMSVSSGDMTTLPATDVSSNLMTGSAATAASAHVTSSQIASPQMIAAMRPQAAMVAAPAELVDIVQGKLSDGGKPERLTVQLDPPELGRVSIDFKFDAQGLQHITVTGETPEAMKQLRQLHYQLTQALEQHGLSGQDMTFEQQFARQDQGDDGKPPLPFSTYQDGSDKGSADQSVMPVIMARQNIRTLSDGLDIKL
ncbi:flagellar hook-length control protein FliK [Henriciella sp.]|uniref:flagellar hook-length control protein FliK n=1 Tax=Henriciella sp. TaxID=1968823 RepID=UPI00263927AF|nr:flagellar hook-length control protein FliK [Henriciella sp.]